jgi:hypothetical protein
VIAASSLSRLHVLCNIAGVASDERRGPPHLRVRETVNVALFAVETPPVSSGQQRVNLERREQMMNTRAKVRAGAAMLMSLASVIGLQGVGAPAMADSRVVHVSGTITYTVDFDSAQLVPRGQQCLLLADFSSHVTGSLVGETEGSEQILFFVNCGEENANSDNYRAVEHFVGTDGEFAGKEATFTDVGRFDKGIYTGISRVQGDMSGVLHVTGSASTGIVTYDGNLVVND